MLLIGKSGWVNVVGADEGIPGGATWNDGGSTVVAVVTGADTFWTGNRGCCARPAGGGGTNATGFGGNQDWSWGCTDQLGGCNGSAAGL